MYVCVCVCVCVCVYLALVCELGGGDVQLLVLLLQLGEVSLQSGVFQGAAVELALQGLVIGLQALVILNELPVRLVQPEHTVNNG